MKLEILTGSDPVASDEDAWNWKKPSRAVVVTIGKHSVIAFYVGPHLEDNIREAGMGVMTEDNIEKAPPGIQIWEGKYYGGHQNYFGDYDDPELRGEYRAPTTEEMTAILAGVPPWNEDDWLRG